MNKDKITRVSLEDAIRRKGEGKTDRDRLRREEAAGIEPEKDPDEGEFDRSRAQVAMPRQKQPISPHLVANVIEFFKSQGWGCQTRINAFLRSYMKAHRS